MVYEYYSPVGGKGFKLPFTALKDIASKRAEIWTKQSTIPAASMVKVVEMLALYAI